MGSFSFVKADKLTDIENIVTDKPFKFLIPIEFGGGYILDDYGDYGILGSYPDGSQKYDMFEILAFWNSHPSIKFDGDEKPLMKEVDGYTSVNRCYGINIGIERKDMLRLKYPLKLVSVEYNGTYEELDGYSYYDPDQGTPRKRRPSYTDYSDSAHALFVKCFGEKLAHDLKSPEVLKSFKWEGIDVTNEDLLSTNQSIAQRFGEDNIEYLREEGDTHHNMLECFIQSVYHYGYQRAMDDVDSGRV